MLQLETHVASFARWSKWACVRYTDKARLADGSDRRNEEENIILYITNEIPTQF